MNDEELRKKLKKQVPEELGLVNWLFAYRKVSFWIVKILLKTKIRPNQITIFEILTFLTSMTLVATGEHKYMIIGAVLGPFCILLDYIDGDLARAKLSTSQFGKALDSACFYLEQILIPMSMTCALYLQTRKDFILLLGAFLVINIFVFFVGRKGSTMPRDLTNESRSIETTPTPGLKIGFHTLFEVDTRLLIFWLGCILNQLIYVLFYFLIWSCYEIFRMYLAYSKKGH